MRQLFLDNNGRALRPTLMASSARDVFQKCPPSKTSPPKMEHLSAKTKREARKPKTCNNDLHEKLEITSHVQKMVAERQASAGGSPRRSDPKLKNKNKRKPMPKVEDQPRKKFVHIKSKFDKII